MTRLQIAAGPLGYLMVEVHESAGEQFVESVDADMRLLIGWNVSLLVETLRRGCIAMVGRDLVDVRELEDPARSAPAPSHSLPETGPGALYG